MGYNPYYNAYQPYGNYYPQGYPQATPQMQNGTVQNQNSIIWVSGLAEAQAYPVTPNSAVALWEQSGKTIFLKSADSTGKPTLRIFDLVERTETAPAQSTGNVDYATKDELSVITGAVKGIMNDVEQLKKDFFGTSDKKPRKKEVIEDDT